MPNPIELLTDPVSLLIFAAYGGLFTWERLAPRRELPRVAGWWYRGLSAFAVYFFAASYLPFLWDGWLASRTLFDLSGMGTLAGAGVAIVVFELVVYLVHRALHEVPFLWRFSHQVHHSAERIDMLGAFYFAPIDIVMFTAAGSLAMVLVLGLTPAAATLAVLVTTFLGMFQHANVKTPRWLGVLVQRPESHSLHHARGVHRYNYSDLPLFDMIFGTFRNPAACDEASGFEHGRSHQLGAMLLGRDAS